MTAPERVDLTPRSETEPRTALGRLEVKRGPGAAALPLAAVHVRARVAGDISEVSVEQTFHNPYAEAIEAVYIFPLPGDGAVSAFEMRVGQRTVRGVVEEKRKARADYDAALAAGRQAALLEQERDDVFTLQVGNLPPGQAVTVRITLSQTLIVMPDGERELRLPLVVAPRYIPGTPLERPARGLGVEDDTDQVRDASRITPPRLVEGFDPGVALTLEVELLEPALRDLTCSQHATRTTLDAGRVVVALADPRELMNRDFVLRWKTGRPALTPELLVHRDADGALYGLLSVGAPETERATAAPRDVLFVLDRSGSMEGLKAVSAARAGELLLGTLGPEDRFGIVAFGSRVLWWSPGDERRLVPADPGMQARGAHFLRTAPGLGGTEMMPALEAALACIEAPTAEDRLRIVVFITDGQVGNERELLEMMRVRRRRARLFTLGIDTAVNEAFLKRVATDNGGLCRCVAPGGAVEDALRDMARELAEPAVCELRLVDDDAVVAADSQAPARLPDLFPGRTVRLGVRLLREAPLTIAGRGADGKPWSARVEPRRVELPAVAHLWARRRITDLDDALQAGGEARDAREAELIALAKRHTLLSRYTSFVAVDEQVVVEPNGERRTVVQPVSVPEAWELERTMAAFSGVVPARLTNWMACELGIAPAPSFTRKVRSSATGLLSRLLREQRRKSIDRHRAGEQDVVLILCGVSRALGEMRRDLDAGISPDLTELREFIARLNALRRGIGRKEIRQDLGRLLDAELPAFIDALTAAAPAAELRMRIDALQRATNALVGSLQRSWVV